MASILRFLSKKFRYIKHGCYQFGQSCAMEKIQKFRSLGARILGQYFLTSRTQEKLGLATKIQPVKKVKKVKEQCKVF